METQLIRKAVDIKESVLKTMNQTEQFKLREIFITFLESRGIPSTTKQGKELQLTTLKRRSDNEIISMNKQALQKSL